MWAEGDKPSLSCASSSASSVRLNKYLLIRLLMRVMVEAEFESSCRDKDPSRRVSLINATIATGLTPKHLLCQPFALQSRATSHLHPRLRHSKLNVGLRNAG